MIKSHKDIKNGNNNNNDGDKINNLSNESNANSIIANNINLLLSGNSQDKKIQYINSLLNTDEIDNIEKLIGYIFKNKIYLIHALIHKSFDNEINYERLEFLGDSVINTIYSDILYKDFPLYSEGDLSKIKSFLISLDNLAEIGRKLKINNYIIMEKGEIITGGRNKKRIIGNVYESIAGAIFLDSSYNRTKKVLLNHLKYSNYFLNLINLDNKNTTNDYKSTLQELIQKKYNIVPKYFILKKEGPDHQSIFSVCVKINNKIYGCGKGESKKQAEQFAALDTLNQLFKEDNIK
ncbi:MAG: ribonuclease III [Candidatus Acididesulfobacter diazotrophicus]|jgi:ribonuclease-3|uniref:Ribonuclease 3 n=1 Tax=Candidatus Acididesulfobacter diazotrophicus TaxID=2597226 RepID=A0A519BL03_9DELT|nr:MAG: ribonuclease III [Candidatus Acididesulfobacter diazotrophicus]